MFDISEPNFIRTLRPFSNLKDPVDTIYDHLPYKKDINLIKESDIRLISGNVVKYTKFLNDEPFIVDSNELADNLIAEEEHLHRLEMAKARRKQELADDVAENEALIIAENFSNELVAENLDMESINILASADENDDDYSFLIDD